MVEDLVSYKGLELVVVPHLLWLILMGELLSPLQKRRKEGHWVLLRVLILWLLLLLIA